MAVISSVTTNTEYIDGIQYGTTITGLPDFIQTEEGRAVPSGTTAYKYYYTLSDHLGNSRLTFDSSSGTATTLQKDDYLPFGMDISRSVTSPKNEYLYNKKELQEELGQYDYGARFYDPVIARWTSVDPLAEINRKWSPYNYAGNNPLRFIDPDGMASGDALTSDYSAQYEPSSRKYIDKDDFDSRNGLSFVTNFRPHYIGQSYNEGPGPVKPAPGPNGVGPKDKIPQQINPETGDPIAGNLKEVEVHSTPISKQHTAADNGSGLPGYTNTQGYGGARLPDYYNLNVSISVTSLIGWNISANLDRYGVLHISPIGVSFGRSAPWGSASISANWLTQETVPTQTQMNNILNGHGVTVAAGYWVGWQYSGWPGSGSSWGIGIFTPQVGDSYNYTPQLLNFQQH